MYTIADRFEDRNTHRWVGTGLVVLAVVAMLLLVPSIATGQSAVANGTANASVAFANQTSNGSTVTIERVRVPQGGFVALQSSSYVEGLASREETVIAVSRYLKPGNYTNLTIDVSHAPPGNYPGLNRSQLNSSQTFAAVAYRDTNNNTQMDFVRLVGSKDTAYTRNGSVVADTGRVTVPQSDERQQATVTVRNQTVQDGNLTVQRATLPKGGFLAVHNESYLSSRNNSLQTAVGISGYLSPGTHRGVRISLLQGAVQEDQTLVVVPHRDTNANQRYDYIASDGFRDVAYENRTANQTRVVTETAGVTIESGATTTSAGSTTSAPVATGTKFRVYNLTVSNQSAHVGDEITVTAWISNPTDSRLQDELALATAGTAAEEQQVALFPQERRAVRFTHSYEAPGQYIVKVANHTAQIRVVSEGSALPTTTPTAANASQPQAGDQQAQSDSSGGSFTLLDGILVVVLLLVLGGILWGMMRMRKQLV